MKAMQPKDRMTGKPPKRGSSVQPSKGLTLNVKIEDTGPYKIMVKAFAMSLEMLTPAQREQVFAFMNSHGLTSQIQEVKPK